MPSFYETLDSMNISIPQISNVSSRTIKIHYSIFLDAHDSIVTRKERPSIACGMIFDHSWRIEMRAVFLDFGSVARGDMDCAALERAASP